MSLSHSPQMAHSGLVFHVDFGSKKSWTPAASASVYNMAGPGVGTITMNAIVSGGAINMGQNSGQWVDFYNRPEIQCSIATISAWFKSSTIGAGTSWRGIIAKQLAYGIFLADDVLTMYDWGNSAVYSSGISIPYDTIHHVAMTFTESNPAIVTPDNNFIMYLDGMPVMTGTNRLVNQNVILQLGEAGTGGSQAFWGKIYQGSVWNRVLSPAEILQNFNCQRARYGV
jgi:hypothetical protein